MDKHLMAPMTALQGELQHLNARLVADSHNPQLYIQRGMTCFKLSDIAASIDNFDRAEQLAPHLTPYLWQRGLAYYYAERFADGVRQFEVDLTVNGQDVEETVWRYLCQAQLQGVAAARHALLPVRNDPRLVMAWIYELFAGACGPETVFANSQGVGRPGQFYSHLYVGLYFEAEGEHDRARQHLTQAAEMQVFDDYMGWLAIVHRRLRGWGAS